jgi:hypothetical protein
VGVPPFTSNLKAAILACGRRTGKSEELSPQFGTSSVSGDVQMLSNIFYVFLPKGEKSKCAISS